MAEDRDLEAKRPEAAARAQADTTRLVRGARSTIVAGGHAVNPPIVRASTVLFADTTEQREMRARRGTERLFTYGARGNPTGFALEDLITELEGGHRCRLYPTGLAAIAMVLFAYLKPGDTLLMSDCVYEPVRRLCRTQLARFGIATRFFDGLDDLRAKFDVSTRMVFVECPGSLVYEMIDLPKVAQFVQAQDAQLKARTGRRTWLVADNTWGSGLQYRPLALGADVSIIAATKYLSGHADVVMGVVTTNREAWPALNEAGDDFGMTTSPDDAYLVLRGMRTLAARLVMQGRHALQIARWLGTRGQVATVFCPALESDPGHALWCRDCKGNNGLLSFELNSRDRSLAERFVDALTLFGIGASWGGFESLVTIADMTQARSLRDWSARGIVIRLHVGLEDPQDLIDDLSRAFLTIEAR